MFTSIINSVNNVFSKQASIPEKCPAQLPRTYLKILWFYYQLRLQGIDKSNYSLLELAIRLRLDPSRISTYLNDLERWGLMASDPHGNAFKKRWITYAAFAKLDEQAQSQTDTHSIYRSSYECDYFPDSKQQQNPECVNTLTEKEDPEPLRREKPRLDEKLNRILISRNTPHTEVMLIQRQLNTARLSPARKIGVVARVVAACGKNRIQSLVRYFKAAIKNEETKRVEFESRMNEDGMVFT